MIPQKMCCLSQSWSDNIKSLSFLFWHKENDLMSVLWDCVCSEFCSHRSFCHTCVKPYGESVCRSCAPVDLWGWGSNMRLRGWEWIQIMHQQMALYPFVIGYSGPHETTFTGFSPHPIPPLTGPHAGNTVTSFSYKLIWKWPEKVIYYTNIIILIIIIIILILIIQLHKINTDHYIVILMFMYKYVYSITINLTWKKRKMSEKSICDILNTSAFIFVCKHSFILSITALKYQKYANKSK